MDYIVLAGSLKCFKNQGEVDTMIRNNKLPYGLLNMSGLSNHFWASYLLNIKYFCEDSRTHSKSCQWIRSLIDEYNRRVKNEFQIKYITSKQLLKLLTDGYIDSPILDNACSLEF
jgi:hypothetical protein